MRNVTCTRALVRLISLVASMNLLADCRGQVNGLVKNQTLSILCISPCQIQQNALASTKDINTGNEPNRNRMRRYFNITSYEQTIYSQHSNRSMQFQLDFSISSLRFSASRSVQYFLNASISGKRRINSSLLDRRLP